MGSGSQRSGTTKDASGSISWSALCGLWSVLHTDRDGSPWSRTLSLQVPLRLLHSIPRQISMQVQNPTHIPKRLKSCSRTSRIRRPLTLTTIANPGGDASIKQIFIQNLSAICNARDVGHRESKEEWAFGYSLCRARCGYSLYVQMSRIVSLTFSIAQSM